MIIAIPGNPIARKVHQRSSLHGKIRQFDPQAYEKEQVRKFVQAKVRNEFLGSDKEKSKNASKIASAESISLTLTFGMPIPKSFATDKLNAIYWGLIDHNSKPDCDNMAKFYLDCLKGIAFKDDAQVNIIKLEKRYSPIPSTLIMIEPSRKMTVDSKTSAITSLISPSEFHEIAQLINEINDYDRALFQDDLFENLQSMSENRELVAQIVAKAISKLADKHAKKLTAISKKYPGYWNE